MNLKGKLAFGATILAISAWLLAACGGGGNGDAANRADGNGGKEGTSAGAAKDAFEIRQKIPEQFPRDIPFPDDYTVTMGTAITDSGEGVTTSIDYLTNESMESIIGMYKTYLQDNGYDVTEVTDPPNITGMKDNKTLIILINESYDDHYSIKVSVMYQDRKS